jgi:hypothetical protein
MSDDYRDDVIDILFASDAAHVRLRAAAGDVLRMDDDFPAPTLRASLADRLTAGDGAEGRHGTPAWEAARVCDAAAGRLYAVQHMADALRLRDLAPNVLGVLAADVLAVRDAANERPGALLADRLVAGDAAGGRRHGARAVRDVLKAADRAGQSTSVRSADVLRLGEGAAGRSHGRGAVADVLAVSDRLPEITVRTRYAASDGVRVGDRAHGMLHARSVARDWAVLRDFSPSGAGGRVWTAHTHTWAMSRYAPEPAQQLAVIGGVVHAVRPDGIWALDGTREHIAGELTTGLLDFGETLTYLGMSYVEYRLAGHARLTVRQPQSGRMRSWHYTLPAEPAESQTNGRFVLGRGLRGRHFGFTLRLDGRSAYLNDWRFTHSPGQRRV